MTIEEMHIAVKLGLDKTNGLAYPAFEPEEIDHWINDAIQRFVKTRYTGNNFSGKAFEQTQKRIDDLYTLVKEVRITPTAATGTGDKPNSFLVGQNLYPVDFMLFLNDEATITFNNQVTGNTTILRTGITECTSDTYYTKSVDPYSEHVLHMNSARPLRLFGFKGIELITDGRYSITYYFLRYICNPAVVSTTAQTAIDCDLPEHTHSEIVEMTINKLLENIEAPRYQTQTIELTKIE